MNLTDLKHKKKKKKTHACVQASASLQFMSVKPVVISPLASNISLFSTSRSGEGNLCGFGK